MLKYVNVGLMLLLVIYGHRTEDCSRNDRRWPLLVALVVPERLLVIDGGNGTIVF